jgi:hypothetical protein
MQTKQWFRQHFLGADTDPKLFSGVALNINQEVAGKL